MNLAAIADAVTKRIGMIGARDVAFCQTSLTFWHERLYRARLWKDSLIEYQLPIDPAAAYVPPANYLPSLGVVVLPAIFQLVTALRTSEHALSVQRPMMFYRVDQDAFAKKGVPLDFLLMPSVAAAFDTLQPVFANVAVADQAAPLQVATVGLDGVSESVLTTTTVAPTTLLGVTATLTRLTKPATQQPVTITVGDNQSILFSLAATDTTAPQRQRVRLVDIPSEATTLRVLGKRTPPPFSGPNDEPGVAGMEGVLNQLAFYDMLCRDERGGGSEASNAINLAVGPRFMADGTSGGLLRALEQEEVAQAAYNTRIMPEAGFGPDEYYIGPKF